MIKIDNQDYDLDTLSDEAKAQLQSLQFVDAELAKQKDKQNKQKDTHFVLPQTKQFSPQ